MTNQSIIKDGVLLLERYGSDLGKLSQDDRVGLMRTSDVSHIKHTFTSCKVMFLKYFQG